ncbi:hypothetical protein SLEP1_g4091 [Rubroshorea leprosula]|uniref:Transmembrane and coiled-coil domain-containing protein 4 n=1 Tax=Rubroshorea leprosula TaxID=152421 RepID=A0AAV5HWB6_9ROSI|nr:hypothetical protein SLEP1_g4091 [Rubroshorea leprosula]
MQASILSPTQKYAASALFALALHHSQIRQTQPWNPLRQTKEEPLGEGASLGKIVSVSDNPQLWIHENSGLLLPVFRCMGLDDKAWHGLKETAGVSSQPRHHAASFLTLLSEESDEASSARKDKELALVKAVHATVLCMDPLSSEDTCNSSQEYEIKCREKYSTAMTKQADADASKDNETIESPKMPSKENRGPVKLLEEGELLTEQRKVTVLYELLSACIADCTEAASKNAQQQKGYDARHRVALRLLATWLNVKWIKVEAIEIMLAQSLVPSTETNSAEEDENKTREQMDKWKRGGIIGAAALTGGTLLAITGGLAAPAIAQGLGALAPALGTMLPAVGAGGFAAAATATGSAAGSAAIAASFGAVGAGLAGGKMARRTGNLEEFEFKEIAKNHNQGRLSVGISISGFAFKDEDFVRPWEDYEDNLERYVLKWESEILFALSTAIQDYLTSRVAMELMKDGAMLTVLSTLLTALAMPATVVAAADIIDSNWAVAVDRSDKAGKLLAEVLLKGMHGNRPVMLIGFSLGARVIFKCLQCLAETKGDNAGIVERVVLLGAPVSIKNENWEDARKMVAGRFVNVYSTNDWTLGIIFRASLLSQGLAGIQPVDIIHGIENVDVTDYLEGHSSYLWKTKKILEQLDLESYYPVFKTNGAESQEDKSPVT